MHTNRQTIANDEVLVSKALLNAADRLEISNAELAKIIGISEAKVSKIDNEKAQINSDKKEFELALLFIRLFRSLDAITAGDDHASACWMRNKNTAIDDIPLRYIETITGLVDVVTYLDSRRARI